MSGQCIISDRDCPAHWPADVARLRGYGLFDEGQLQFLEARSSGRFLVGLDPPPEGAEPLWNCIGIPDLVEFVAREVLRGVCEFHLNSAQPDVEGTLQQLVAEVKAIWAEGPSNPKRAPVKLAIVRNRTGD